MTYVTTYGLKGIIDSSLSPPSHFLENSCIINPSFFNWNRLNSIVKGWINNSIFTGMMGYLRNGMIAREQYKALEESYFVDI